jgi:hypothetical protein
MRRVVGYTLLLGAAMAVTSWAVATGALAAPGNNGTVKVDGVVFDDLPNNEPHVGCTFQIDFYGYDEGQLFASASFDLDPPTGAQIPLLTRENIFIGEDSAAGGGSTAGLDASETFDLSGPIAATGEAPHPQQGFHIGLTVHADGSIGADVKHKEFWVSGCGAYPPTAAPATSLHGDELASNVEGKPVGPPSVDVGAIVAIALVVGGTLLAVRRTVHARVER